MDNLYFKDKRKDKRCEDFEQNQAKALLQGKTVYKTKCEEQLKFKDFYLPFGGKLDWSNRWIKLSELIP